jgi:DNA-binding response OmpR family regulator
MWLLLIEPYPPLARALSRGLEEEGFAVDLARDKDEGDGKARTGVYDVILLDVDPPENQGVALVRDWRRCGLATPVVVLVLAAGGTGCGPDLEACATLGKPFPLKALLTCIHALAGPAPRGESGL